VAQEEHISTFQRRTARSSGVPAPVAALLNRGLRALREIRGRDEPLKLCVNIRPNIISGETGSEVGQNLPNACESRNLARLRSS
jgi:hypothetical protein